MTNSERIEALLADDETLGGSSELFEINLLIEQLVRKYQNSGYSIYASTNTSEKFVCSLVQMAQAVEEFEDSTILSVYEPRNFEFADMEHVYDFVETETHGLMMEDLDRYLSKDDDFEEIQALIFQMNEHLLLDAYKNGSNGLPFHSHFVKLIRSVKKLNFEKKSVI